MQTSRTLEKVKPTRMRAGTYSDKSVKPQMVRRRQARAFKKQQQGSSLIALLVALLAVALLGAHVSERLNKIEQRIILDPVAAGMFVCKPVNGFSARLWQCREIQPGELK